MKVFISRDLKKDSPFLLALLDKGIEVVGSSLLNFKPLKYQLPKSFLWIFFYSKTGVDFFFKTNPKIHPKTLFAAIGPATAEAIKVNGHKVSFCGDGIPESTAKSFFDIAGEAEVLFVRAKESNKSIQKLLKNLVKAHEIIAYENYQRNDFKCSVADWLVFTSSLNAKTYFSKCRTGEFQKILAIGEATAKTLQILGIEDVLVSKLPDEVTLANTILENIQ